MREKIILTPEELYFMGALLQAKYIDYAYVAAMGDIQQRREIYESESKEGLAKKGILIEDFSGRLEADVESKKLLEPVFFGMLESSVDIFAPDMEARRALPGRRFHFYEGRITTTAMGEEGICIEAADAAWIQAWLKGLLPDGPAEDRGEISAESMDRNKVDRIITVKSILIGEKATIEIYVEAQGSIFCEKAGGQVRTLTREQFCLEAWRGIKGE